VFFTSTSISRAVRAAVATGDLRQVGPRLYARVGPEQRGPPPVVALLGQRQFHGLQIAGRPAPGGELREPPLDGDAELEDVVELAAVLAHPLGPALLQCLEVTHPGTAVGAAGSDEVAHALERAQGDAQRDP